jgi:hypothetical protein
MLGGERGQVNETRGLERGDELVPSPRFPSVPGRRRRIQKAFAGFARFNECNRLFTTAVFLPSAIDLLCAAF